MNKKRLITFLAVLLCLILAVAACGGGDAQEPEEQEETGQAPAGEEVTLEGLFGKAGSVTGLSYDYIFTDSATNTHAEGSMWLQGKKTKIEAKAPTGETMVQIIDMDAGEAYSYMPDQNMAFKIDISEINQTDTPMDYVEGTDTAEAEYLGEDAVDGISCHVWKVAGIDDSSQCKMWVHGDYGIPVKVEITGPEGNVSLMEYKNITIGELPDETFTLPEGVEVQDMGEMMEQLQSSMPQQP